MITFYNSFEELCASQRKIMSIYACSIDCDDIEKAAKEWCENGGARNWAKHNKVKV